MQGRTLAVGSLIAFGVLGRLAQGAVLEGSVRDAAGAAVAGATVELRAADRGGKAQSMEANATGEFRFVSMDGGNYTLVVSKHSFAETTLGPFAIGGAATKHIDVSLRAAGPGIEFSDEPKFTVAGVSDSSYYGGHGSDAVVRSAEKLTKATASLAGDLSRTASRSSQRNAEADLHHAKAVAQEKAGDPLQAVREYQRAAELAPSETNLFDWGTELLVHKAAEAAIDVFTKGTRLFPGSSRMRLGAAVAFYANGDYVRAAQSFFEATDVNPEDPTPYLFLGKAQAVEITQLNEYSDRLTRFWKLDPDNAWANYYYALEIRRLHKDGLDSETQARVASLLRRAVEIDGRLGPAYLQLGQLYAMKQDALAAIGAYEKAIEADPQMAEAHYELAQEYRRTGQTEKAQREFTAFQQIEKSSADATERERSELQQFLVRRKKAAVNQ